MQKGDKMLVVGYFGKDGVLGRTLLANNESVCDRLRELMEENKEELSLEEICDYLYDNCVFETMMGYYFIGGLEE